MPVHTLPRVETAPLDEHAIETVDTTVTSYVVDSLLGDDNNPGTVALPWAGMDRVVDAIRHHRAIGQQDPLTFTLVGNSNTALEALATLRQYTLPAGYKDYAGVTFVGTGQRIIHEDLVTAYTKVESGDASGGLLVTLAGSPGFTPNDGRDGVLVHNVTKDVHHGVAEFSAAAVVQVGGQASADPWDNFFVAPTDNVRVYRPGAGVIVSAALLTHGNPHGLTFQGLDVARPAGNNGTLNPGTTVAFDDCVVRLRLQPANGGRVELTGGVWYNDGNLVVGAQDFGVISLTGTVYQGQGTAGKFRLNANGITEISNHAVFVDSGDILMKDNSRLRSVGSSTDPDSTLYIIDGGEWIQDDTGNSVFIDSVQIVGRQKASDYGFIAAKGFKAHWNAANDWLQDDDATAVLISVLDDGTATPPVGTASLAADCHVYGHTAHTTDLVGSLTSPAAVMLYGGVDDATNPPTLLQVQAAHAWSFSVGDLRRYQWHKPSDLYSTDDAVTLSIPAYPTTAVAGKQVRWRIGFKAMALTGSLGTGYDVEIEEEFNVPSTAAEYFEAWITIPAEHLSSFHIANIVIERVAVVDGAEHSGGIAIGVPHVYYTRTL